MNEQNEGHPVSPDSEPGSSTPDESKEHRATVEAQDDAESSKRARAGRGSAVVAWLALLLALVAGGLSGWQWWVAHTGDEPAELVSRVDEQAGAIESQAGRIDQLGERFDSLDARLEQLANQADAGDFDPDALRRRIRSLADSNADLREELNSLSQRLDEAVSDLKAQVEQTGSDRAGRVDDVLADARFRLGLIEVSGLLRLGQSRADLAADPVAAVAAYRQAQSRLETIDDTRVERLRQLVARELEALRSVDSTDWSALAGRLSALEIDSAQWLLAGSGEPADKDRPEEAAEDTEGGWWSSLGDSLGSLVRVTPREAAPLTPAAVESVRERLRLHLAAAQAAAARRNVDELAGQLEIAGELIRAHFDTGTEAVSRALETISEAASVEDPSLPDLGEALTEAERRMAAS
ncbi:uroporphyrinogen-III C-methyltransferase [Wenzhouxiangella sp. EGI_FJ10305]|uniref:uroporphyrinogen-III C-methyltransferase n=1 Tax=Wenzhouxiangella sp. EGI_FJ10305 TaxID=3243768 RepID=UPI0035DF8635